MIDLESFRDVHPNWETIQSFDEHQSRALLELLEVAVYLDDHLTRDEVEMLTQQWLALPNVEEPPDATALFDKMLDTYDTIHAMRDNPTKFDEFLDRVTRNFSDSDAQYAAFRLVAIATASGGFDDAGLEMCFALGEAFEFDPETVEDLLRSVWETYRRVVDEEAGREHKIPPVLRQTDGSGHHRRSIGRHPNPFSTG